MKTNGVIEPKRAPGYLAYLRAEGACVVCTGTCDPCQCDMPANGEGSSYPPLCVDHHVELHRLGRRRFSRKYKLDLAVLAARWFVAFQTKEAYESEPAGMQVVRSRKHTPNFQLKEGDHDANNGKV